MLFGGRHLFRRGCLASMIFLAMVGSVGCRQSEEPQPGPGTSTAMEAPMTFRATGTASESRCTTEDALGNNFAVAAWKSDATQNTQFVMSKDDKGNSPYIVQFDATNGWHYADLPDQYLKYWDLSAQDYTFYALANYEELSTAYDTSFVGGFANIKSVSGHIDTPSVDILESYYRRVASPLADYDLLKSETDADVTPLDMIDVVPLKFHHVMAAVQFLIYDSQGTEIQLNHLKIAVPDDDEINGIFTEAEYKNGEFIEYDKMEKLFCDKDIDIKTGTKANPSLLYSAIELPQRLSQSVEVTIDTDDGVLFGTIPLGNTTNGSFWQKDTIYKYILIVHTGGDIILVDVKVDDWEMDEDPLEQTQTNW